MYSYAWPALPNWFYGTFFVLQIERSYHSVEFLPGNSGRVNIKHMHAACWSTLEEVWLTLQKFWAGQKSGGGNLTLNMAWALQPNMK